MSKKCKFCGNNLEENMSFCGECGNAYEEEITNDVRRQEAVSTPIEKTKQEKEQETRLQAEAAARARIIAEQEKKVEARIKAEAEAKVRAEYKLEEQAKQKAERKKNPRHLAILSLILGIVSYAGIPAPITLPLGIVFGIMGLKSDKKVWSILGLSVCGIFILLIPIGIFAGL